MPAPAAPEARVHELAQQETAPLLDTLRDLVSIESGSKDVEGLARIAALIADRLRQLGGKVEVLAAGRRLPHGRHAGEDRAPWCTPNCKAPAAEDHADRPHGHRLPARHAEGPALPGRRRARLRARHRRRQAGRRPDPARRRDANKLGVKDYGTLTVLINGDEEISSPGSRSTITRMAGEQDAVFSFEGGGSDGGLRLATSGIGSAYLTVEGKSSHAGAAPRGRQRALRAVAPAAAAEGPVAARQGAEAQLDGRAGRHQPQRHPGAATAQADARALRVADFDELQAALQAAHQDSSCRRRQGAGQVRAAPAAARSDAGVAPAGRPRQAIYGEIGVPMKVVDVASGGGTDAAFAALKTEAR